MAMKPYRHFTVEPLAPGVYAAIVTPTGAAAANSGIIVLGDRVVIVDTTATVTAGRELRQIAADLTGLPVSHVLITHPHPDHVHGNVAFASEATLMAAAGTGQAMAETGLKLLAGFRDQIAAAVKGVEAMLAGLAAEASGAAEAGGSLTPEQAAERSARHAALEADRESGQAFLEGFPTPADYRQPHLTFAGELTLQGADRIARIIACGQAHSEDDAVLYLPKERILFAGDLVTGGDLVFRYGNVQRWLTVLDRLESLGAETLVPGHGPVMPARAGIDHARQYITDFVRAMEAAVAGGATEADAETLAVPAGAEEYWYRDNARVLLRRLTAAGR